MWSSCGPWNPSISASSFGPRAESLGVRRTSLCVSAGLSRDCRRRASGSSQWCSGGGQDRTRISRRVRCDSVGGGSGDEGTEGGSRTDADWLKLLPDASSALYCCSLPGIEAWLRSLGFQQLPVRPEEWRIEKDTWHADLSLDVTEICVKYASIEKQNVGSTNKSSVERRFSYALSRQDLENAILSGP